VQSFLDEKSFGSCQQAGQVAKVNRRDRLHCRNRSLGLLSERETGRENNQDGASERFVKHLEEIYLGDSGSVN
jgi:hypothetical protein